MHLTGIIRLPFVLMSFLLIGSSCYQEIPLEEDRLGDQHNILSINHIYGITDLVNNRIFFTLGTMEADPFKAMVHFEKYTQLSINGVDVINDAINDLGRVQTNQPFNCIGICDQHTDTFEIVFTTLPLLHVVTEEEIIDEPKSYCKLHLQYDDPYDDIVHTYQFNTSAGIEIRGASSMRYSKVSYGIELWRNRSEEDYKTGLLDMRSSEDWILDAMYIDDLRMRNKISFDTWKHIHMEDGANDEADYPGINCRFIELLINNEYMGLYCLNEKLDPALLGFTHDQCLSGGLMYKAVSWSDGSTRFEAIHEPPSNSYIWDGWEQIYPAHDTCWNPLSELRNFIVNSNDEQFEEGISDFMNIQNLVDYYLFVNLVQGYDNAGKNTYLVRWDHASGFHVLPWDIEATWGLAWNREKNRPAGIVTNHLFDRLIETDTRGFTRQLVTRWEQYRSGPFSEETITGRVAGYYRSLAESGAYAREKQRWQEFPMDHASEYAYITEWIHERLGYLDEHFQKYSDHDHR
jgi:hypothetical protein